MWSAQNDNAYGDNTKGTNNTNSIQMFKQEIEMKEKEVKH